jgi:hypothetical protein
MNAWRSISEDDELVDVVAGENPADDDGIRPARTRKEDAMTTLEHQREAKGTTSAAPRSRRSFVVVIVAVLALLVGGFAGYMIGDANGSDTSDRIVLAGEGELTARQEQMVDFLDDYMQAWRENDSDAVVAMYTEYGTFRPLGEVYAVDDDSFVDWVERHDFAGLENSDPVLVNGNTVLSFHTVLGGTYSNVLDFANTGDLLLVSHTIND